MCKLIMTGQFEAIDLKALHGEEVLQFDEHKHEQIKRNGGFCDWLLEMRRGVFTLLHVNESYPLKARPRKVIPMA